MPSPFAPGRGKRPDGCGIVLQPFLLHSPPWGIKCAGREEYGVYIHYNSASFAIAHKISHVPSDRFLIHSHPYYELHYFLRGDVELIYDGQIIHPQPHGLTLMDCNVPHGLRVMSDKDYERFTVHFTEDLVLAEMREGLLHIFRAGAASGNHVRKLGATNIQRFMKELVQLYTLPEEQREQLAPPMILAVLICVMMNVDHAALTEKTAKEHALSSSEVIEFINAHLTEPMTLTELAHAFYCSKGYLNSLFKRETGVTVMNFIQVRRLNYARMLIENGYPVTKACAMAGFSEYSSFFRAYVKHFGASPSRAQLARRRNTGPQPQQIRALTDEEPAARRSIWSLSTCDQPEDDPSILTDQ